VDDRQRAGEVGDEDDRGLERGDENGLEPGVVRRDRRAELLDAGFDLLAREVDLADSRVGV
jgi:hypothetical protein